MVKASDRTPAIRGGTPVRARERFLVFGAPVLTEAEVGEVVATVRSGWLGTGPRVARFEHEFQAYKRASHAVAVNSCTAALHLSLLALRLQPGDEVITSALTFCATVNAIIHAGGQPVLADCNGTMNIDPAEIERAITPRTRAILPIHFAGRPCDMEALVEIARRHNLAIVEDCAHAVETEYRGKPAGTFGRFGCFSFYSTKNLTTGEGGMILADADEDAATVKTLALHGMSDDAWRRYSDAGFRHYDVVAAGFKYNMMDLQAALGIHQLERVDTAWSYRQRLWRRYDELLCGLPLDLPAAPDPDTRHAYHLYTVLVRERDAGMTRDELLNGLTAEGIGVGVHYRTIPDHPYYRERFGWHAEQWPRSHDIGSRTISLPLTAGMTESDIDDVVMALKKLIGDTSSAA